MFQSPRDHRPGSGEIAVCSTALSALAYRQLHDAAVMSAMGATPERSPEGLVQALVEHLEADGQIVIALDRNEQERKAGLRLKRTLEARLGDGIAERIRFHHPNLELSAARVSWNDVLEERVARGELDVERSAETSAGDAREQAGPGGPQPTSGHSNDEELDRDPGTKPRP